MTKTAEKKTDIQTKTVHVVEKGTVNVTNAYQTNVSVPVHFKTNFNSAPDVEVSLIGFRQGIGGPGQASCMLGIGTPTETGFILTATTNIEGSQVDDFQANWSASGKARFK